MKPPKTRNENIVVQEMEKEILIYDLQTNKAFCLNETSALIYQLCDGKKSITEIADLMSIKLKTLVSEEFIWLALDKLKQDDLLEKSGEFEIDYKGLNRRQVIKKIGFASMIALPVVSSIVAPSAAAAQSSGVLRGGACPPACAAGLQCRSLTVGSGSACCGPAPGNVQTFPPGPFICLNNCTSDTALVCCSGSGTTAPTQAFCTNNGLQTCTCDPYS